MVRCLGDPYIYQNKCQQTKACKIISSSSEIDYKQHHGVCMSQQMFISGSDQPDDQPEHRLGLS